MIFIYLFIFNFSGGEEESGGDKSLLVFTFSALPLRVGQKEDVIILNKVLFNLVLQKAFKLQRQLCTKRSFTVSCGKSDVDGFYNSRAEKQLKGMLLMHFFFTFE